MRQGFLPLVEGFCQGQGNEGAEKLRPAALVLLPPLEHLGQGGMLPVQQTQTDSPLMQQVQPARPVLEGSLAVCHKEAPGVKGLSQGAVAKALCSMLPPQELTAAAILSDLAWAEATLSCSTCSCVREVGGFQKHI
ncbi:MAG: hypothetical protein FRX49_01791 [Trebouxia sp. A1-2]|nr:MAG: hypothetical protein FRX49_01791 [Trebouxia sp. A1-2]